MRRGHELTHPSALDLPEGFDPSGVPCDDPGRAHTRATSPHRRRPRKLPGLSATSLIASVEEVAAEGDGDWLVWGCVCRRPVLFAVGAGVGAEMMDSVTRGEATTAIVEPWQLMLERLD